MGIIKIVLRVIAIAFDYKEIRYTFLTLQEICVIQLCAACLCPWIKKIT